MMANGKNLPELDKYLVTFAAGETLFCEGDTSQDIYVLMEGTLAVFKDDKKLSEINEAESLVGEMAYLLGEKRTATIKAATAVKAVRIPAERISDFLTDFPTLAPKISQTLARRLHETTKVVHGLKEFCDQLPDAVIMTDKDRKILAWNRAAERLHGRSWEQMREQSLAEVYQSPEEYRQFIDDIYAGRSLSEMVLPIRHPQEEIRYVSTSTTILYDGHHNINGFIFLGRDVTRSKTLETRYRRMKQWLIPSLALAALLLVAFCMAIPYFNKGVRILDQRKESFSNRIVADSRFLENALADPISQGDTPAMTAVFRDYFSSHNPSFFGISGMALLNRDKEVVAAYCPNKGAGGVQAGYSYGSIPFRGDENSSYRVLILFHADAATPMGRKGAEIAYAIRPVAGRQPLWLLFQLDMAQLDRDFGLAGKVLQKMQFRLSPEAESGGESTRSSADSPHSK